MQGDFIDITVNLKDRITHLGFLYNPFFRTLQAFRTLPIILIRLPTLLQFDFELAHDRHFKISNWVPVVIIQCGLFTWTTEMHKSKIICENTDEHKNNKKMKAIS
jgi:hypothetical protein